MISEQRLSIGNLIICEKESCGDSLRKDGRVTSFGDGGGKCKILPTSGMTSLPRCVMEVRKESSKSCSEGLESGEKELGRACRLGGELEREGDSDRCLEWERYLLRDRERERERERVTRREKRWKFPVHVVSWS